MTENENAPLAAPSCATERADFGGQPMPPLTKALLNALCDAGGMSSAAWLRALDFCGFRPDGKAWLAYWRLLCLIGGTLFVMAGVVCFIAWNWGAMPPLARMGLTGAVVACCGLGAVLLGPDTRMGQVLLLACGIAMGPMLAVFGQSYQTGAELWELFRVWTALLVLLALAGRQVGLWFAAWISANIYAALWLGRDLDSPFDALGQFFTVPEWLLAIGCAVVCWEWAALRAAARIKQIAEQDDAHAWLCSRWMPRLLFVDLTSRTTFFLVNMIFGYGAGRHVLWLPHSFVVGFAVGVAGLSWWWYRKRQPDLFMLAALLAGTAAVLLAVLAEAELFISAGPGIAILLWGLLITGMTAGLAKILLHLQHSMPKTPLRDDKDHRHLSSIWGRTVACVGWQELWAHLQAGGLVPQAQPLPQSLAFWGAQASPWYVRAMLAFGGWLAAVFFVCFTGLLVNWDLHGRFEGLNIFLASIPLLLLGWLQVPRQHLFARHFGFALAVAGTAGASVALVLSIHSEILACLALAALLFVLCLVMCNAAYRFLAVVGMGNCVATGILFALAQRGDSLVGPTAELVALWWGLVCLALVYICVREGRWRGPARGPLADALFYGLFAALLLFQMVSIGASSGLAGSVGMPFVATGHLGVGAAAGVAVMVFCLMRHTAQAEGDAAGQPMHRWVRWAVLACMPLVFVLGWFLPGVALTLLGLLLARQMACATMQGFALAFFGVYLIFYYYSLAVPLAQKSLYLVVTGLVLLAVASMLRLLWARLRAGEAAHA